MPSEKNGLSGPVLPSQRQHLTYDTHYSPEAANMNKRQIHARLIEHGSNFRRFALDHGYEPRSVTQAVQRWAESGRLPRGRVTCSILRDLSQLLGEELVPGILDPDSAQVPIAATGKA